MDIKTTANEIRARISTVESAVLPLKAACQTGDLSLLPGQPCPDRGEMIANTMLAYRHLEDARMRLGKVIQAFEGGVSCYDKEKKP